MWFFYIGSFDSGGSINAMFYSEETEILFNSLLAYFPYVFFCLESEYYHNGTLLLAREPMSCIFFLWVCFNSLKMARLHSNKRTVWIPK